MKPLRRYALNNLVINNGSPVIPIHEPFNSTFVISLLG